MKECHTSALLILQDKVYKTFSTQRNVLGQPSSFISDYLYLHSSMFYNSSPGLSWLLTFHLDEAGYILNQNIVLLFPHICFGHFTSVLMISSLNVISPCYLSTFYVCYLLYYQIYKVILMYNCSISSK